MNHFTSTYGSGSTPKERLAAVRQHLLYAKQLSGSATQAFQGAEKDSESASAILKTVSQDVFEASLSHRPTRALSGAGERAEESLGQVIEHHQEISLDLTELHDIDPELEQALRYARSEIDSLGGNADVWLIRNAIDSAQREEVHASRSLFEMERSLSGVDKELGKASESAGGIDGPSLGSDWGERGGLSRARGRWGRSGSYGHRWGGRHRHHTSHGQGRGHGGPRPNFARQWRERWETRIREIRQRGAALEESANRLDNPFETVDASAQRGQRYQQNLTSYVDQALQFVDQLERRLTTSPTPSPSLPWATPSVGPTPPASAPIAIFDTPAWPPAPAPNPTPAPSPAPAPSPPPAPAPGQPEGFFKRPWRSSKA